MLLDSSVWIEHLVGGPRTAKRKDLFADPSNILVSAVSLYEVGRYVRRTSGEEVMEEVLVNMGQCQLVPVDAEVSYDAVLLAANHSLHMADALIAATAKRQGAELLTLDSDLLRFPGAKKP
ncbi:MAG: type II toxin-antitoxin system VapC family toxin [Myxococcota bacterium]